MAAPETPKGPGLIRARISSSGGGDYWAVGRRTRLPAVVVKGDRLSWTGSDFRGLDRVLKGRGS